MKVKNKIVYKCIIIIQKIGLLVTLVVKILSIKIKKRKIFVNERV